MNQEVTTTAAPTPAATDSPFALLWVLPQVVTKNKVLYFLYLQRYMHGFSIEYRTTVNDVPGLYTGREMNDQQSTINEVQRCINWLKEQKLLEV